MFDDKDFEMGNSSFGGHNPYYAPENCGLKIVAEIELSEPDYSFDTRVVWIHNNGKLYTAHDSGCSCPTPFEDFHSLDDLTLLTKEVLEILKNELRERMVEPGKAQDFMYKIRDATRK